jgi:hypothetical protein
MLNQINNATALGKHIYKISQIAFSIRKDKNTFSSFERIIIFRKFVNSYIRSTTNYEKNIIILNGLSVITD